MADTAAEVLAPTDPTWNPPPAAALPATVAAPAPSMPPVEMQPVQPSEPAAIPIDPSPDYSPGERQFHESWWRNTLDKVGTILGGDQTYKITKAPDGTMTASYEPSTTGEKWGRVAMAALGGAAKGLANSQGPGGLARAAAAGTQFGLQQPAQQRAEVNEQITADQKRQNLAASNAILHQRAYQTMLEGKDMELNLDQKSAGILKSYADDLKSDPNAKDFGVIAGPDDLMRVANQNADFLHNHTNLQLKAALLPKKGGGWEIHAVAADPGEDMQPAGQGAALHVINTNPKTGDVTLGLEPLAKGSRTTKGELRLANQKVDVEFAGLKNNYNKTNKPPAEKLPTKASLAWTAANSKDPDERAAAKKALDALTPGGGGETDNPLLPATKGTSVNPELPSDDGSFLNQFSVKPTDQGQAILDQLPTGKANLVQRFGNYLADEGKELPRGKEREPFLALVSAVYPNFDSAHYDARRKTVESVQGDGKIAQSRNALNLAIQHMGEMYDAMTRIGPGEFPPANKTNRFTHLSAGFGDKKVKEAYGGYADANEGVASEMARVFKGGAPTQTEVNQYRGHADPTQPKSVQIGSFKTRLNMMADRMNVLNRQLQESFNTPGRNYQLLTPEAITTMLRLPGGKATLKRLGYQFADDPNAKPNTTPPAGPAAAPAAAPAGNRFVNARPLSPGDTSWIDNPTGMQGLPTPVAPVRPAGNTPTPAPPASINADQAQYKEGDILVNPQTKKAVILRDNVWQPM